MQEEHDRIISKVYSITSDPSREGGGHGAASDSLGENVATLMDLCRSIDEEVKRYIQVRDDVMRIVRKAWDRNEIWGQCLHYRYIRGYNPTVSAWEMGYEPRSERKIHAKAVECVCALLSAECETGPLKTA